MALEYYIRSGQKQLRCGYTTGTCAALATAGAVHLLLFHHLPGVLAVNTPKGIPVEVSPVSWEEKEGEAFCAVTKDGGDDADVTHGLLICAAVKKIPERGIRILGGKGVGKVTKPGLDQPVGEAAINRVPRKMITEQALSLCEKAGYTGGLEITISVPEGEETAKKTFNPMLGVVGGISILGTSGIVMPMSEQALVDTIDVEIRQAAALGSKNLILTPGNYGEQFLQDHPVGKAGEKVPTVKCSNFVGDALDLAVTHGFKKVLLVGHIGKFVKLAAGMLNTHSKYGDCRAPLFCAYAAAAGASTEVSRALLSSATADRCLEILEEADLKQQVLQKILEEIQFQINRRVKDSMEAGVMVFSNVYGCLGITETGKEIIESWNRM
jgi:cobalt-precorrin-5B (C1)-methyltransferase